MKAREIKQRISSVNDTVKITRAMQMIATSKLQRSQRMFSESKTYLDELKTATDMMMSYAPKEHPYFFKAENKRSAYIVIADDKGFCADYNSVILEKAYLDMQSKNISAIFSIGHMAWDFFRKKDLEVSSSYLHLLQNPMPEDAQAVTDDLISRFLAKEMDEVYIFYTEPETLSRHKVVKKRLLPVEYKAPTADYPLLSDAKSVSSILNHLILAEIYFAIASASLAVNFRRMVAMQQSTSNGEEILEELILEFNHKRQERITNELLDSSFIFLGML